MFDNSYIGLIGLVLMTTVLLRRLATRRKTDAASHGKKTSRDEGLERLEEKNRRRSLEGLLVEIHDYMRETQARVDNKLRALSLQDETRTRRFESQQEMLARMEALETRLATMEGNIKALQLGRSESAAATGLEASTGRTVTPSPVTPSNDTALSPYHDIFARIDRGQSIVDIARETDFQQGEIELILGLRKSVSQDA